MIVEIPRKSHLGRLFETTLSLFSTMAPKTRYVAYAIDGCHPKFFPRDRYEYGSYIQNHNEAVLPALLMDLSVDAYVPNAVPDHRNSPLLAESLRGLPPTRKRNL